MSRCAWARLIGVSLLAAASGGIPQPVRADGGCVVDVSAITPLIEAYLARNPRVPGIAVYVSVKGEVVYERYFGSFSPDTVIPIASATKWLSGAAIMAAAEDPNLNFDLDDPLARFVPAFDAPLLRDITIRQAFAHTSGLPGDSLPCVTAGGSTTLAQCAAEIALGGLRVDQNGQPVVPGSDFFYGGNSMHAAGRALEVAAGQPFAEFFQDRITGPLGMTRTVFNDEVNPHVAGGARSTLRDYAVFAEAMLGLGERGGVRILSPESVLEMFRDQTFGVPITYSPVEELGWRYGIGLWRDIPLDDDVVVQASSPGAFGFTPWVDTQRQIAGVFMTLWSRQQVEELTMDVQRVVRDAADAPTNPADFDGSGTLDGSDFLLFLAAFFAQDQLADLTGDGVIDGADFLEFLALFFGGC